MNNELDVGASVDLNFQLNNKVRRQGESRRYIAIYWHIYQKFMHRETPRLVNQTCTAENCTTVPIYTLNGRAVQTIEAVGVPQISQDTIDTNQVSEMLANPNYSSNYFDNSL